MWGNNLTFQRKIYLYHCIVKWIYALTVFCVSCAKGPDFIKNAGKTQTEVRALGEFTSLEVFKNLRIYLKQGTANEVRISYGKNLLPKIKTEVNNGVLRLDDKNTFNWVRDLKKHAVCTLTVKSIQSLLIEGSAQISCLDSIKGNKLFVTHNSNQDQELLLDMGIVNGSCDNSGAIKMEGKASILAWTVSKGSFLDARSLDNEDTYIFHFTMNDCYVRPKQVLEATIGNSGHVISGLNPSRILKRSGGGSGKIKI